MAGGTRVHGDGGGRTGDVRTADRDIAAWRPPHSPAAEQSVVGQCIGRPKVLGQVVGTLLEPDHFYSEVCREIFGEMVSRYYADEPIDALSLGRALTRELSGMGWGTGDGDEVVDRMRALAQRPTDGPARAHAAIIKRDAAYRAILRLTYNAQAAVHEQKDDPEKIAGSVGLEAMRVATMDVLSNEIVPFDEIGTKVVRSQQTLQAARAQGIELGAYFGLSFLDSFFRGLKPSELVFIAGEPGAGKSAVIWKAAQLFAERQLQKPRDRQIGTLVLSLEMAQDPSDTRLAQTVTQIDGGKLREGRTDDADLQKLRDEWARRKGLPLYFNYSSTMRFSQLRALCVEAVRRHNVGVIVIDHFRYVDMDPPPDRTRRSQMEAEEDLARALKQDLATELNVAVICLAHTTKAVENRDGGRPKLSDLRGSGQVAAHADYVAFVYRPYSHATQDDIDDGRVARTDAEMIWEKNRHGLEGTARFFFDPSTMTIY